MKVQGLTPETLLPGEATHGAGTGFDPIRARPLKPEFSKIAAILVPIRSKPKLLELYSLHNLERLYLLKFDIILLQPEGLNYKRKHCRSLGINHAYFSCPKKFAGLMTSPEFYSLFHAYEYLLEHRLDCLIFKDRLALFCSLGRDYIPAAWIPSGTTWPQASNVGLGGLSLRKVSSFERVSRLARQSPEHLRALEEVVGRHSAEDVFWGRDARRVDPTFQVCTLEESLRFGFNGSPTPYLRWLSTMPPFGCHAFSMSTRDFLFYSRFVCLPWADKLAWIILLFCLLASRGLATRLIRFLLRKKKPPHAIDLRGLLLHADHL